MPNQIKFKQVKALVNALIKQEARESWLEQDKSEPLKHCESVIASEVQDALNEHFAAKINFK